MRKLWKAKDVFTKTDNVLFTKLSFAAAIIGGLTEAQKKLWYFEMVFWQHLKILSYGKHGCFVIKG